MANWYIVKINWNGPFEKYAGLGGDCWPDIPPIKKAVLKKVEDNSEYVEISGTVHHVVTDRRIAEEYFEFLHKLNLKPLLFSVSDDLEAPDTDGYDYGHPAGGYSVIESAILTLNDEKLKNKYLNELMLFKSIGAMNDFLELISDREDIETMNFYCAVSIKVL